MMKISVQVGDKKSLEIACGEGNQSIRWLALVAAQRLQLLKPKGRSRMREKYDARRGFLLPQAVVVKGHDDSIQDPEAIIKNVMQEGSQVEVVLMEEMGLDDVGAPMESDWFLKAFGVGEATKRRLNGARLREVYKAKVDVNGADGGVYESTQSGGVVAGEFDVTVEGVVISGPLETVGQIRAAMEHDWRSAGLGEFFDDPNEAAAVKRLLQAHLPALNRVHASRSGGESGARMSFNDFGHLLHRCGVMPYSERHGDAAPTEKTRKVFKDACRGIWPGDGKSLNRAQFLAALVLTARTEGRGGRRNNTLEPLKRVIEEKLLPSHDEATVDNVGAIINREEVQRFVSNNRRLLHSAYLLYAEASDDGAFVTLEHFREMMDDCGAMPSMTATSSGQETSDSLVEACFLEVQGKSPLPVLVFTDCIDAACRLAIMNLKKSSSQFSGQGTYSAGPSGSAEQPELDAIFFALDCMIDLGLGDKGLST
ncbi:unnamed protein product [Ascophyllum nodosum]